MRQRERENASEGGGNASRGKDSCVIERTIITYCWLIVKTEKDRELEKEIKRER